MTRKIIQVVLWVAAGAYALFGLLGVTGGLDGSGTDPAGRGISAALGVLSLMIAGAAGLALFFGRKYLTGLILAGCILILPVAFFATWYVSLARSEARARVEREELHSGKTDFGDQPALFALAQAIRSNDPDAIRAAAKAVPDLQAPGRDGKTLLYFAVTESWQQPELVTAIQTLLSLGADPNFTNEHRESYAMAESVHASVPVLRAMLDAGGNPNALDFQGTPMIFRNWQLSYFEADRRTRFELLLDRGADINSTRPPNDSYRPGYTLMLYRASEARGDGEGYIDALRLLERGADPHRAAADGTTLAGMLKEHQEFFTPERSPAPASLAPLLEWARTHGLVP